MLKLLFFILTFLNLLKHSLQIHCRGGYFYNSVSQTCQQCRLSIVGCAQCKIQTSCEACLKGYYKSVSSLCLPCTVMSSCMQCSSISICTHCSSGFYVNQSGLCNPCNTVLSGCLQCNHSSNCLSCHHNYYLKGAYDTSVGTTVYKCQLCTSIANCIRCTNVTFCDECRQGYYPSLLGICTLCGMNCLSCEDNLKCYQCNIGYYKSISGSCLVCSTVGCLACDNSNTCKSCKGGTYLKLGSCIDCTNLCITCTEIHCLTCINGYYYNVGMLGCVLCDNQCATCNNTGSCLSCNIGNYLLPNGSCNSCVMIAKMCVRCEVGNCLGCGIGYYLYAGGCQACSGAIIGCADCDTPSSCYQCLPGLYLNAGYNACLSCTVGCSTCLNSTACYSCTPGYYLDTITHTCPPCANNCTTCTPTMCLSCHSNLYLQNSSGILSCETCDIIPGCIDCYNNTYCISCRIGMYVSVGHSSCLVCLEPCLTCQMSNVCNECKLGYYVNGGSCISCGSGCVKCGNGVACQQCGIGWYLDGINLVCSHCSNKGCQTCTNSICLSCSLGFYLTLTNQCTSCSQTLSKCILCSSSTICQYCQYGYTILPNNTCGSCATAIANCLHCTTPTTCEVCNRRFYLKGDFTCESCMFGCSQCMDGVSCEVCGIQFVKVGGVCHACEDYLEGCKHCLSTALCIDCRLGLYLAGNVCHYCSFTMAGCLYCNSSTICTHCQDGYYLNLATNVCMHCSKSMPACQLCNSSSICLDCQTYYYLNSNTCKSCTSKIAGCRSCLDATHCIDCKYGYYKTITNICVVCSSQLTACIHCQSQTQCIQCEGGYYLSTVSQDCHPCVIDNCQICLEDSPTNCLTCNSDYYISAGVCNLCYGVMKGCLQCSSVSYCLQCDVGYGLLANHTCNLCSEGLEGCTRCLSPTVCLQCKSLYYVNTASNLCERCSMPMQGCNYCVNSTHCQGCGSGYYLKTDQTGCRLCTTITGCRVCTDNITCLDCKVNYYKNGTICYPCDVIEGCHTCLNNVICSSCVGGYTLTNQNICRKLYLSSAWATDDLQLKTTYFNHTTLLHKLIVSNKYAYKEVQQDWSHVIKMYITDTENYNVTLNVLDVEWGYNLKMLKIYTQNPLNLSASQMPLTRLLLEGSVSLPSFSINMQIAQSTMKQILPDLAKNRTMLLGYALKSPEFYTSYTSTLNFYYYYLFGLILTAWMFSMYFVKAIWKADDKMDMGLIIPHVLAMKFGVLVLFPTYSEFNNYCWGFMTADFPWANLAIGDAIGDNTDIVPDPFTAFYVNLNFGSLYLIAFLVSLFMLISGWILGLLLDKMSMFYSYRRFLYNFFILGMTTSSCLSFQGTILNTISSLTINTLFYVLGIIVFMSIVLQTCHSLYQNPPFYIFKLRVLIKCIFLCFMHFNVIYTASAMLFVEVIFIIVEYAVNKDCQVSLKWRVVSHLLCNTAFGVLVFVPEMLLGIYLGSGLLILVFVIQTVLCMEDILSNRLAKVMDSSKCSAVSNPSNNTLSMKTHSLFHFDDESGNGSVSKIFQNQTPHQQVVKFNRNHKNKAQPEIIRLEDIKQSKQIKNDPHSSFLAGDFLD